MQADVILKEPPPMGAPPASQGGARVDGSGAPHLVRHYTLFKISAKKSYPGEDTNRISFSNEQLLSVK